MSSTKKTSRPYRLASPSQTKPVAALSDDSLSEQSERVTNKRRPHSAFVAYESPTRQPRFETTPPPPIPPRPPSVYLIEVADDHHPENSFGLSKTLTYVWKNSPKRKGDVDLNKYPKYSVEQVPPITDQRNRSIPISSRHIVLQRGKTDYWQNTKASPDSLLTSSCQKHTGSASNLLSPALETSPSNSVKHRSAPNGHVISVTTTKRRQPSLLNETQNSEWNVEGDGKQVRYSNLQWFSADQLQKDNRPAIKPRTKRKLEQSIASDSATDTGSSTEQQHQSAPAVLQEKKNDDNVHRSNGRHEGTISRMFVESDVRIFIVVEQIFLFIYLTSLSFEVKYCRILCIN